jgi:hypothetical protein
MSPKSLWLKDLDAFEKELDVSNAILCCYASFRVLLLHLITCQL